MPQVRDRIVAEFGMEPESYDPDEAVAKGAALFGLKESLQDEVKDILAPDRSPRPRATGGDLDLAAVSEAQVAEALDQIERELGFTLTGPVRELVNTRIVNVLSKSLGVVARDDDEQGRRRLPPAPQRRGPDGAQHRLRHRRRQPGGRRHPRHGRRARQPRARSTARTSASPP